MDLVLHLHPAPERPGAAVQTLAHSSRPPRRRILTVYTKGDLVPSRRARHSSGIPGRGRGRQGIDRLLDRCAPICPSEHSNTIPTTSAPSRCASLSSNICARRPSSCWGRAALLLHRRGRGVPRSRAAGVHSSHAFRRAGVAEGDRDRPLRRHHQGDRRPRPRRLEELIGDAGVPRLLGQSRCRTGARTPTALTRSASPPRPRRPHEPCPELLEILVCPKCKGELEYREPPEALVCHACRLVYAVEDGIPIMLIDEAKPLS